MYHSAFFYGLTCALMCHQGYALKKAYIATQAPMEHTVADFWQMVWENKVQSIVMLTREKGAGKVNRREDIEYT